MKVIKLRALLAAGAALATTYGAPSLRDCDVDAPSLAAPEGDPTERLLTAADGNQDENEERVHTELSTENVAPLTETVGLVADKLGLMSMGRDHAEELDRVVDKMQLFSTKTASAPYDENHLAMIPFEPRLSTSSKKHRQPQMSSPPSEGILSPPKRFDKEKIKQLLNHILSKYKIANPSEISPEDAEGVLLHLKRLVRDEWALLLQVETIQPNLKKAAKRLKEDHFDQLYNTRTSPSVMADKIISVGYIILKNHGGEYLCAFTKEYTKIFMFRTKRQIKEYKAARNIDRDKLCCANRLNHSNEFCVLFLSFCLRTI